MLVESIGAVLLFSQDPEGLVAFYTERLGLPLKEELHPGAPRHFGCVVGDVRFAIHDSRLNQRQPGVAFSLTTLNLNGFLQGLAQQGIQPLHPPVEMGRGAKRVTIRDCDGNHISLVQLAEEWAEQLRAARRAPPPVERQA
jgi:predicted enzyme related to lactoylglutathione lyase